MWGIYKQVEKSVSYSSWQPYSYFFTMGSMSSPISVSVGNKKDTTYIIGKKKTNFTLTRKANLSNKSFLQSKSRRQHEKASHCISAQHDFIWL